MTTSNPHADEDTSFLVGMSYFPSSDYSADDWTVLLICAYARGNVKVLRHFIPDPDVLEETLNSLRSEGFIARNGTSYAITNAGLKLVEGEQ